MPNTDTSIAEIAGASAAMTQQTRMAERIAALEARTGTEIAALKEDTRAIRNMFHDANNKMQILIGAEVRFSATLQNVEARLEDYAAQFKRVIAVVEDLAAARTKAEGAWWIVGKISLVIGFVGSSIAAISATVWWAMTHLSVKP